MERQRNRRLRAGIAVVGLCLTVALAATAQLAELQDAVISVYETASPAVVHITVRGTTENAFMQPIPVEGSGSGFLYDREGHIVTNYHVIEDAEEITVAFGGSDCCPAEVVGVDPSTDLAVLRVDRPDLPAPLPLGDSDALQVGQFIVAIGNPFGLEQTMTFGIVSALERVIQSPDGRFVGEAIQTDAAVNPGNSGGPMLNLSGEVVGVTSQIISPVRGSSGVGFAISASTVRRVVPSLVATGRFPHPYLGISGFGLTPEIRQLFRANDVPLPFTEGVLITSIEAASPADFAGLRAGYDRLTVAGFEIRVGGDVILAIDGQRVASMLELTVYLDVATSVGQTVEVAILRDGERLVIPIVVGERPPFL